MRKSFLVALLTVTPALGAQVAPAPVPPPAPAPAPPPAPRPATSPAARPSLARIPIDRVVAIVGSQPLLWSDVLAFINQQRAAGLTLPPDSAGQAAFARDALNQLIDEEILVQKAHEMKIEVTEGEVNRTVDDQVKRIRDQFKTDEEYRTELRNAGFGTPEEYRRTLYTQRSEEHTS